MLPILKKILTESNKNILILSIGTTIAQAIPVLISPILTRLYSPSDFGLFALYFSISTILAIIASGRYELAIVLPKRDNEAVNILFLTIIFSLITSLIALLIISIFHDYFFYLSSNKNISFWLYFLPLSMILTAVYQSFYYWFNRRKKYKEMSYNRIIQNIFISGGGLSFGYSGLTSSGLIIARILGQLLTVIWVVKRALKLNKGIFKFSSKKIKYVAKKYINFPKFSMLGNLIDTFCSQFMLLFLSYYGLSVLGLYALMLRVVSVPSTIISSSIGDDFRQRASQEYAKKGECKALFKSTFKKIFVISFIPFTVFYFIAPELFSYIFGEQWARSGVYAQILTPMLFIQFISSPLSSMYMIYGKQKLYLYYRMALFASLILSMFVVKYFFENIESIIITFSAVSFFFSSLNILSAYFFKNNDVV